MATRDALVVDDDPEGRDALAQLLELHGYAVRQAENGQVALDMILERPPRLLLLDLEMPVMSGWEVLARIHGDVALHEIVIVVFSAAAAAPADVTFVRKPCAAGELLQMIHGFEAR